MAKNIYSVKKAASYYGGKRFFNEQPDQKQRVIKLHLRKEKVRAQSTARKESNHGKEIES